LTPILQMKGCIAKFRREKRGAQRKDFLTQRFSFYLCETLRYLFQLKNQGLRLIIFNLSQPDFREIRLL